MIDISDSKIYNWGIIGLGKIANKFARDLKMLPNANLKAVASSDIQRAKNFATEYGVSLFFDNYEAILVAGLDIIYIATPNHLHCEWTVKCLDKKIAVLVEKPFAINSREADIMQKSAIKNQTFLMEAMWTRFLPTTQKVLEILVEGTIGNLLTIKADFCYKVPFDANHRVYNNEMGGGSLLDVGIYPVYLSYLLFGTPENFSVIAIKSRTEVDESCFLTLKYKGKQVAFLHSSFSYNANVEAFIYGTKGSIHIKPRFHGISSGISIRLDSGEQIDYPFSWDCLGYKYEAAHVMDCLNNGLIESNLHSINTSLELCKILDTIRKKGNIVFPNQDKLASFEKFDVENE